MIPPRIKSVVAEDNYCLNIVYENGENKKYNMTNLLNETFYQKLKNKIYFKSVKNVGTTVEWPDGEDIDPNELYEKSLSI